MNQPNPSMQCPKCGATMNPFSAGFTATVHRCENCHGIACNDADLDDLQRQWFLWPKHDTRDLDTGTARAGKHWNKMTEVACPACGKPMRSEHAPGQEHIRLDRCQPCGITFFDAGEMTDLRYDTLADTVRGLIAKLRRR
jgi:Zn-finger nucleic acid-binding protein